MKIALLGYGKMGRLIDAMAREEGHDIVLRIDADNTDELRPDTLADADVAIEFSVPEAAADHMLFCFEQGVPVVCGTTGWQDQLPRIRQGAKEHEGALLYASNFSIGVNLFFALNRFLADHMARRDPYDPQLEEIHHTEKLDAPSGTALTLAQDILQRLERKERWVSGLATSPEELAVSSRRIGQVRGIHTVRYDSPVDTIEIRHEAHSREGFAGGALQAAAWLIGRQGVFTMSDMLGF